MYIKRYPPSKKASKPDIAIFSNPYDGIVPKCYRIKYVSKNSLTIYVPYSYTVSNWYGHINNDENLQVLWKYFFENRYSYDKMSSEYMNFSSKVLLGYLKMDELAKYKEKPRTRKKIILAPHHTILENCDINFATFMQNYDMYLELPVMYPQIDFVFRPHPLLKAALRKENIWGEEKTQEYFNKIQNFSNVEYQEGGDYFETFINSDGLIHDCGSFMAEYLFTGKPPCFLLKDETTNNKNYNDFAKECINTHYHAFSKQDVQKYIENVVLAEHDPMKQEREKYFNNNLKLEYPNAGQVAFDYIKKELGL